MIYACKFWFLKIDSILYSFQKCEYSYIDDKWWNWWSAFPDCIKLEFPLTAFSTGCKFVLLLFKEEQRYFPPFPSTKHPLGMFPSPFLSFLAPRPLIPSVGNTTCQTAQAPMLIITQDKKKSWWWVMHLLGELFFWLVALMAKFPKCYTAPNLLYCSTRYRCWMKHCCALVPNMECSCVIEHKCEQLHLS